MSGDVTGFGQKLWETGNTLGQKASGLAHTVVDSDLGKAAIGAVAGPEFVPMNDLFAIKVQRSRVTCSNYEGSSCFAIRRCC
jgi:hypothetical protein